MTVLKNPETWDYPDTVDIARESRVKLSPEAEKALEERVRKARQMRAEADAAASRKG
ncbi:hypothetical protein [Novacetimonas maltaceti]|uniref:Uncharacterized protein n=1 Tax=Novacetimonas maltaceti TaxID=1203393 RepID=A0A2S3VXI2_9PROT|nr:hypothetical protein [Novacetimonas maltaceti]POF61329.1 hypothetical protein KMAL_30390 [Novacetimonas maltaceti]